MLNSAGVNYTPALSSSRARLGFGIHPDYGHIIVAAVGASEVYFIRLCSIPVLGLWIVSGHGVRPHVGAAAVFARGNCDLLLLAACNLGVLLGAAVELLVLVFSIYHSLVRSLFGSVPIRCLHTELIHVGLSDSHGPVLQHPTQAGAPPRHLRCLRA